MLTSFRAALSAVMLAGFYVYALAIAAGLFLLTAFLIDLLPGAAIGKLVLVTLAVPFGILVATWRLIRAKPHPPAGLRVRPGRAPGLWTEARAIAAAVGTRPPDEIRLVPEVNAAVSERTYLLGLIGGRRYLYIGVPLLQAMTVSQLRAVLAHEFGHYSHSHTRLGALTYRGRDAIAETIRQVGPTSVAGWMMRIYFRLYLLVSLAVSRRQELEADRAAVRVAGRHALATALRELPALATAWDFYLSTYVAPGLEAGYAPTDVLKGFPRLLDGRQDELAPLRHNPPAEGSRWDSHPPIAHRIKLIAGDPDPGAMLDRRPASVLLDTPDELIDTVEQKVFDFGDKVRVPLHAYTHYAIEHQLQREADRVFRAAARQTGRTDGVAAVLDAIATGRGPQLAHQLYPDATADELANRMRATMELLFELAAVKSGVANWRLSWSGPAELCLTDGRPLDLSGVAAQATHPHTLSAALAALAQLRINPAAVSVVEQQASVAGANALAGLVNVVVDGRRADVVVLDAGLVVVPGLPRLKIRKAKPRMHQLLAAPTPDQLTSLPGSRFIPVEEIETVQFKRLPVRYELGLHDGRSVKIRWGGQCEEIGRGWDALASVVARAAAGSAQRQPVLATSER